MAEQFLTQGPVEAGVRLGAGEVVIEPAAPGTASAEVQPVNPGHEQSVRLAASAQITFDGSRLDVSVPEQGRLFRRGEVRVILSLPPSSSVGLKAGAVDVGVTGGLVGLDVRMGSGEVRADKVDELAVKAGQVDVEVDVAGAVTVATGQGSLRALQVGDASFKAGSGRVELGRTDGNVAAKGGSVDLTIREAAAGAISFTTGSGDARIGVVPGTTVELDLISGSGDVRCDLSRESSAPRDGANLRLRLKTGSGDLLVAPMAVA